MEVEEFSEIRRQGHSRCAEIGDTLQQAFAIFYKKVPCTIWHREALFLFLRVREKDSVYIIFVT